jgi:Ca-activated chloride channel family protein
MKRKILVFFVGVSLISFSLFGDEARRGEKLFQEEKFKESSEAFLNAEIDEPSQLQHAYNRGVTELRNKNYESATEAFTKASQSKDEGLKKDSLFNLGHALYGKGALEDSLKAFDEYLKIDPKSKEAEENKSWIEKKIKEQKEKQDQKKDSEENKDKKDKQDEQDKQDQKKDSEENKDKKDKQDQKKDSEENKDKKDKQDQKENSEENKDKKDKQDQKEDSEENKDKKEEEKPNKGESSSEDKEEQEKKATKDEIERLLRTIDNMQKVYGVPPKVPQQEKKLNKDW